MKFYQKNNCRLCGSNNLNKILGLTPTPWADDYQKKEKLSVQKTIPLDLYQCSSCFHVQLKDIIDAEEVYLNYIYETVSTLGLGGHFKDCVKTVMEKYNPKKVYKNNSNPTKL